MKNLTCRRRIVAGILAVALGAGTARAAIEIRVTPGGSDTQQLAAKEIVRYLYLRTGLLPEKIAEQGTIVVARKDTPRLTDAAVRRAAHNLQPQQYVLRTTAVDGKKTWWIVGGDDRGTLYGAYRFAEKLGVRFYLHGDVIPDERLAAIPEMDETGKPLFGLRGVNPWGSHPFGFDAWGTDDYKAIFTQLAKMRMNFLGIHCYPEGASLRRADRLAWPSRRFRRPGASEVQLSVALLQHTRHRRLGSRSCRRKPATTALAGRCCSIATTGPPR